jgi:hypothetical protein
VGAVVESHRYIGTIDVALVVGNLRAGAR